MARFWKRASAYALLATKERFVKAWRSYLESIIIQAARRDRSHYICTIEEYMTARRDNIGTDPCFALMEMSLETDIPHYIMEHPTIVALTRDTNDMIVLTNVSNELCPLYLRGITTYKRLVLPNRTCVHSKRRSLQTMLTIMQSLL